MKKNQEVKQEAVKKIVSDYYDRYPLVKPFVQENGYFPITNGYVSNLNKNVREFYNSVEKVFISAEDHEEYYSHFMPKGLSELLESVEHNNFWIRIEHDGSNLPTDKLVRYKVHGLIDKKHVVWNNSYDWSDVIRNFKDNCITHYKPITPDKPPVY